MNNYSTSRPKVHVNHLQDRLSTIDGPWAINVTPTNAVKANRLSAFTPSLRNSAWLERRAALLEVGETDIPVPDEDHDDVVVKEDDVTELEFPPIRVDANAQTCRTPLTTEGSSGVSRTSV
jgi:hypothetical protein